MVTAAFRHCLLNRIVLEIMVSVIYLCNSTHLVIVHVVWELSCMNIMQSLFPLIQGKKIACFLQKNDHGLPGASILYLLSFKPSLVRVESLWSWSCTVRAGWLVWTGWFCPRAPSRSHGACFSVIPLFSSDFPAQANPIARLEGKSTQMSPTPGCDDRKREVSFMGSVPWDEDHIETHNAGFCLLG